MEAVSIIVAVLVLACSVLDWRDRKIPNILTAPAFLAGVVFHTVASGFGGLGFSLLGALVGFLILVVPYSFSIAGAGDVKMLMATGAWVGAMANMQAFMWACIISIIMAIGLYLYKGVLFEQFIKLWLSIKNLFGTKTWYMDTEFSETSKIKFPYAVPIALGFYSYFLFGGLI